MKIRRGFVSNSSSSSFMILCKEEITKELIMSLFEDEKDPINRLLKEMLADFIIDNCERTDLKWEDQEIQELAKKMPCVYKLEVGTDADNYYSNKHIHDIMYNNEEKFIFPSNGKISIPHVENG